MDTQTKQVVGRGCKRKKGGCKTINGPGKRPKFTDDATAYEVSPDGEVLTVYLLHTPTRTERPSLKGLEKIALKGHNELYALANDELCSMFVDTGTTINFIEGRDARILGLDKEVTSSEYSKITLFTEERNITHSIVEDVEI